MIGEGEFGNVDGVVVGYVCVGDGEDVGGGVVGGGCDGGGRCVWIVEV